MSWIDDVVTLTTIASTWGNRVRDRIVQTFDSAGERDTRTAALPTGSVCNVADSGLLYVKQGGAWRPVFPAVVHGFPGHLNLTPGAAGQLCAVATPAGFRSAVFLFQGLCSTASALDYYFETRVYCDGLSQLAGRVGGAIDAARAQPDGPSTFSLVGACPINIAGSVFAGNVTNLPIGGLGGNIDFAADAQINHLTVICLP